MIAYEQVESYMKTVGLKYIKDGNELIAGLALRTNKEHAKEVAVELNARGEGAPKDNADFYALKNKYLEGSIYISAAFDGGVFRHIGNMVIDHADLFKGEVLDLCCDCGIVTCFMAQQYPDCHFTGIDINESAITNAKALAEKLGVSNVTFVCTDVYEMQLNKRFALITSFRCLLDAAEKQTRGLPFIGYRPDREKQYQEAFTPYAAVIAAHLAEDGSVLSVERYTAEYGWLGWMQALEAQGIYATADSTLMRAQDIASVKEYSVTFAVKETPTEALTVFNDAMGKDFKSGTGYEGGMAEFALYADSEGEIEFTDVLKKDRMIHQFAFAKAKSGKNMYYDASNDKRVVKYMNDKKLDKALKDYEAKLALYDKSVYEVKKYKI